MLCSKRVKNLKNYNDNIKKCVEGMLLKFQKKNFKKVNTFRNN